MKYTFIHVKPQRNNQSICFFWFEIKPQSDLVTLFISCQSESLHLYFIQEQLIKIRNQINYSRVNICSLLNKQHISILGPIGGKYLEDSGVEKLRNFCLSRRKAAPGSGVYEGDSVKAKSFNSAHLLEHPPWG